MANHNIPRRPLGRTGLEVSVLSFGGSPIGGIYQSVEEDEGLKAVHEAFNSGINYFDTSPWYGELRAEIRLGKALKTLPRDKIILATKCGRYPTHFNFDGEYVTKTVKESMERLQVDYLDVIQIHDIEFGDLDQIVKETLPALQKLKKEGLVRHIGITGLPLKIYQYVIDRVPEGTVEMILAYCHATLQDDTLDTITPYLQERGIGIVAASALSMGLLSNRGPPEWHPAPKEVRETCAKAAAHAKSKGVSIERLAIQYAFQKENVSTVLIGMATPAEVTSHADSASF
ncbi:hypothetical protein WJX84_011822 [Apatococcus fuscideae]|uniref:NADP-dependent oxidoreductase domain-containing protein n=1 Tax=Apatococcus fuscideae TaxID=2026836 RepID=A0AAW1SSA1_9CHLO